MTNGLEAGQDIEFGDIFLTTHGTSPLSNLIVCAEKFLSKDKKATYSHAGFIDENGKILDTLWRVRYSDLCEYQGRKCAIYRPVAPLTLVYAAAQTVRKDIGKKYPWQRLFLHLFRIADNIHWDRLVCSERTAKFLHLIFRNSGCFDFEKYYGWTPDMLHDYMEGSVFFKKVFEQTWI